MKGVFLPGPLKTGVAGVAGVSARKTVGFVKHIYMCDVFQCVSHIKRGFQRHAGQSVPRHAQAAGAQA